MFADRQARREAWRFNARSLNQARAFFVSGDQEVGEGFLGWMEFRTNAASAQPQILEMQVRQQLSCGLEEIFNRDAAAFIVVPAILVADRGTEGDVAVDRLGEVYAKRVAVC